MNWQEEQFQNTGNLLYTGSDYGDKSQMRETEVGVRLVTGSPCQQPENPGTESQVVREDESPNATIENGRWVRDKEISDNGSTRMRVKKSLLKGEFGMSN